MLLLPTELIAAGILRGCYWLSSYLGGIQILDRNLAGICSSRHPFDTRALQPPDFSYFRDSGGVGNFCQEVTLYLVG